MPEALLGNVSAQWLFLLHRHSNSEDGGCACSIKKTLTVKGFGLMARLCVGPLAFVLKRST